MDKVVEELKRIMKFREKILFGSTDTTTAAGASNGDIKVRSGQPLPTLPVPPPLSSSSSDVMSMSLGEDRAIDGKTEAKRGVVTSRRGGGVGGATASVVPPTSTTMNAIGSVRRPAMLGVCLSSRRNLCIHPEVGRFDNRNKGSRSLPSMIILCIPHISVMVT
jgi:hypothetical protein